MDSSRRRTLCDLLGVAGDDDLEEGEYVPGDDYYQSSNDNDHDRQSSRRREIVHPPQHGAGRMRRLEDIVAVGRVAGGAPRLPPSPTPSSESEGTISDDGASSAGVVVASAPTRRLACHVCGKGFSSRKAVDGHMRVHGSGSGRHVVAQTAGFISAGWAATGRRGWTGGKPSAAAAASLNSESTGHSTAVVAVQPLEAAVPMAFAMTNLSPTMPSSTRTNLSGEDDEGSSATATVQPMQYEEPVAAVTVVAGANSSSSTGAGARARAGPVDHQLATADQARASQVHSQAVAVPPPAAQKAAQFAQQPPLAPPPAVAVQLHQQGQLLVAQPAEPPREYSCKVCGKTYSTHQGLGGHAAGHKNRQREQEAMAAAAGMMMMPHGGDEFLAGLRRGRKAEAQHTCQKCQKVFPTGVALGGHMRMHYTGPPIVHKGKKRCVALVAAAPPPPPAVTEADLRLALAATKTTEEPSSSTAPAVAPGTGRLRLFGFDIEPLGQEPSEQQGSGTTEGSSSAGEQEHK